MVWSECNSTIGSFSFAYSISLILHMVGGSFSFLPWGNHSFSVVLGVIWLKGKQPYDTCWRSTIQDVTLETDVLLSKGCISPPLQCLADTAKRKASNYVDPCGLGALNTCRLIALDTMPGVWAYRGGWSCKENYRKCYCEDCESRHSGSDGTFTDVCRVWETLTMFAKSQPHAAFSTFAHGVISECMSFIRMVPLSSDQALGGCDSLLIHSCSLLKGTPLLRKKGTFFTSNHRWGHGHVHPTLDLFTAATILKDLFPFLGVVLNQQQVLDPNLTQKHASSKCEAVCLQVEEKSLMMKTTVESLSPRL